MKLLTLILSIFVFIPLTYSQKVIINKKSAEVWGIEQIIAGSLDSFYTTSGMLHADEQQFPFMISPEDSSFVVNIKIGEGTTRITAEAGNYVSDTLELTLAYELLPEIFAYAQVIGSQVNLKITVKENPKELPLTFSWKEDPVNPAALGILNPLDSAASVILPAQIQDGEYYFDVYAYTSEGDTVSARTYITVTAGIADAFKIETDYASWIDSAVIYEVTPYIYVMDGKFNDITAKIPDIIRLGVNTIWLQPVYSTHGRGQGYDIIDYFKVRADLGTEADLRYLIQTAKANGLKVMFDFVPNHSSINHPYAKHSAEFGKDSHYWDFYQRETDNAPYSSNYHFYQGFINYFWDELPNLNYNNPEVRNWIMKAALYWVKKLDIDGYRFDAVWGVTARYPQFTQDLRIALKSLKPELLLLGEDKASQPQVFDKRFDAAFDWMPEESWVSHWSWQTSYNPNANPTIFNYPTESQRSQLLRNAISYNGAGLPEGKVLRFLGNNDLYYFSTHIGVDRTKMASVLPFTLPGIPLIYNGEEIGKTGHPYSTSLLFYSGIPNETYDQNKFFPHYKKLAEIKKNYKALHGNNYSELVVTPGASVFGFRRWEGNQNIFTFLNMKSTTVNVNVSFPVQELALDTLKTYYLTDLMSGEVTPVVSSQLSDFLIPMNRYTSKIYLLADSVAAVPVEDIYADEQQPGEFYLAQNYPNPFNPATSIYFTLPAKGHVELKVFDILGSETAVLENNEMNSGNYTINFDGRDLPSGVYIYRMVYNGQTYSKKMMLLK